MKPDSRQYLWGPLLVLAVTLAATAAVVWQVERMADAEDAVRFDKYVAASQSALNEQVDFYLAFLRDGAALFNSDSEPAADRFRAYVARTAPQTQFSGPSSAATPGTDARYAGLLGVGWIRREETVRRKSASATISAAGAPRIVLDNGRYARFAFAYAEPQDWRRLLDAGNDLFTDPRSRAAMERARDSGKPVISGKVTVIREFWAKKRTGFHIFLPIYSGGGVPVGVAARREALRGFLQLSVLTDEMFAATHAGESGRQVDLQVYDGNQSSPDALLYSSESARPGWDAGYRPRFATSVVAELPGRTWGMNFSTRPEFELASEKSVVPNIMMIGAFLSFLLAGINLVQRRTGAALTASEMRYRRLFEASPDGVFLFDADSGRITDVNPYMVELFGLSREEFLAKSLWNIGLFSDEEAARAAFADIREKSYRRYDHLAVVTPTGRRHDVEFTCNSYMSGRKRVIQCNVRNITDRKRVENALRESEERYRSLMEITPQGVWLVALDGQPLYINRSWIEYSGMSLSQSEHAWTSQIHPDDREEALRAWAKARAAGAAYESEVRMRRASDGSYRWHLMRGVPGHDAAGQADKWLCMFIDIDERKQAEQHRAAQLQREQALRGQAEAANRAKDDFLATLSHELRTPLNAILGWTQTLQHGDTDRATVQRALAQIDASANAQARLINDLLNVADIGSGRMRLDIQPVDLAPMVDSIVESLRPALTARAITFDARIDPQAGRLAVDAARLQQIIWNLLSNAVKFTAPGGHVSLRAERDGAQVRISVSDDGEGVSLEFLPYVFDRFRQADASIKRKHGGLGLGLAIVRHLAELHGGSVMAESAGENRGARFSVALPLQAPPQLPVVAAETAVDATAPSPARGNAAAPPSRPRLTGLRILSVDDDPNTREMLQEALERAGARVTSAASAPEAIERLRSFKPDVLVSDIGLPEIDGYDLLREIRKLQPQEGGTTPAVALTGYAREQDQKAALSAGYQEFVAKPVNLDDLAGAILRANQSAGR
ncbi:MAG TPA: PAS domain S-box protein [Burkholderiales bacterium]|nr:PAS domain S-box protein [Burkholderiales bacterium]